MFNILLLVLIVTSEAKRSYRETYSLYGQSPNVNFLASQTKSRTKNCQKGDCYPETGDLLIGRTKFLHASSTCGLTQPERYCVLGTTRDPAKCFVCDSREPYEPIRNTNSHTIENIVSRKQGDRFNRWWQSENGKQSVYIQFDLEAEFAFTHIIMTFKTFRPAAMIIEKSSDFGRTWKAHGYFAANCAESFPDIPTDLPKNLGDLYCESKYSLDTPSTKGEVVFRILPPSLIQSRDPYSPEVQNLLKITNLRVNFTKLHTFGDNLLDSREEIKEKYYYSMYEMVVRGSCLCYGHSGECKPVEGVQYDSDKVGMVHGQCKCQHNTRGTNCQECLPLYNDRRWQPARVGQTNECKKCECHGHARSCHFDEELFKKTNYVTGGVCENCQHNTEGINCEKCIKKYWRDPEKSFNDTETCKPCLCDLAGSLRDGECDPYTDKNLGLEAGKCHCKSLVEGASCDRCKNGFYNLTKENPDGCQPCSCNLIGTNGNLGCNKINGSCECKKFVDGRDCDKCMPGYYGLSLDDPNGCKPCDCSLGGSYDSTCDAETGQCHCKPNMSGRKCDIPDNGFYCPTLDHYIYEAENANKLEEYNSKSIIDVIKELSPGNRPTWTGKGFVRMHQNSFLEFTVDNLFKTGHYEIVLRYQLVQASLGWNHINILVERNDTDPNGLCAGVELSQDITNLSIQPASSYLITDKRICMEAGRKTRIKILVLISDEEAVLQERAILLDSILLVPVVDELPVLQGPDAERLIEEFNHYGCRDAQLSLDKSSISEQCNKFICNIGVHSDYALSCDCNPTGSNDLICDWRGGNCDCKTNVAGRKCQECLLSTYGFGPNGCFPCNCDSSGAKDNFCDSVTGQCDCISDRIQVKQCDQCNKGYWRFPNCIPCECNGFADSCNQTTGECINCKDNTWGFDCGQCKDGFYGNPPAGQPCKQCMCPGLPSGNQFASTCKFDPQIDGVRCDCSEGYTGYRCEKCDLNYYGNPTERDGSCKKCQCNENIDPSNRASCDEITGKCNNCLYNTAGDHCDICKSGFYGNAPNRDCKPCYCNPYGTEDNSADNCDRETGKCACLPNVVGDKCNECAKDHYGLDSGKGCSFCNCDTDGTVNGSTSCSPSGQCQCLESRGGLTCSECKDGYWGDPRKGECKPCECSPEGSLSMQCDKLNGSCLCRKGVTGYNCNRCDRGTTGNIPYCTPCGECYDSWADILNDIKLKLESLEEKASNLAVASASSIKDFAYEYNILNEKLQDIKKVLSFDHTDRQIKALNDILTNLEKQIQNKKDSLQNFEAIRKWNADEENRKLESARLNYQQYKIDMTGLNAQIMELRESHQVGAIESIQKAAHVSDDASLLVDSVIKRIPSEFKPLFDALQQKINDSRETFENSNKRLDEYFQLIEANLSVVFESVSSLNGAVCGAKTSLEEKCSPVCGGAGCDGKCGTNSSLCSGLLDTYNNLLSVKQNFDEVFSKQELTFKRILTKLKNSSNILINSNRDVNSLLEYANKSLNSINSKKNDINELIEKIESFIQNNKEKPGKIELNCDYAINKNMELNEKELDEIINKINQLSSKINVGSEADSKTEATLANSIQLVQNADKASLLVKSIDDDINKTKDSFESESLKADSMENSFESFQNSNNKIQLEMQESGDNLVNITKHLSDVQNSIEDLKNSINLDVKDKSSNILAKQESLKSKVKESGVTLERTKNNLNTLKTKLDDLTKTFQNLIKNKDPKNGADILESLISLQSKIINQKNSLDQKSKKIENLLKTYDETKKRIAELQEVLSGLKTQANKIKDDIQVKQNYYNSCA